MPTQIHLADVTERVGARPGIPGRVENAHLGARHEVAPAILVFNALYLVAAAIARDDDDVAAFPHQARHLDRFFPRAHDFGAPTPTIFAFTSV
jgi:hypothetical protein